MRTDKNEIPSTDVILALEKALKTAFTKSGFISDAKADSRVAMKIGLHMRSFRIDVSKLGHNRDYGYVGLRCKAGYKLTDSPTWSQREDFNHLVNDVFDRFKLSAQIKSGTFVVRSKSTGRVYQWSSTNAYNGGERLFEIKS
jgi:hypothetical protein